jgi:hypothetical protein
MQLCKQALGRDQPFAGDLAGALPPSGIVGNGNRYAQHSKPLNVIGWILLYGRGLVRSL